MCKTWIWRYNIYLQFISQYSHSFTRADYSSVWITRCVMAYCSQVSASDDLNVGHLFMLQNMVPMGVFWLDFSEE